jgi:hypothetical protein
MPYKIEAQRKFMQQKKLKKQRINVKECDKESNGLKLSEKIKKR